MKQFVHARRRGMNGFLVTSGRTTARCYRRRAGLLAVSVAGASLALIAGAMTAVPASAQGSAPGAPGADSLGPSSKVWYTIGNGELENAFSPETDTPDTFGLQYVVTDGSSFTETETTGTTHAISLLNESSLVWQQVNKAGNGDFTITKTYIADRRVR
jgi:glucoamylase